MIIPLNVATDGYLGCDSKTLAIGVNGYLCTITIEPVVPPGDGGGGYLVKGLSRVLRRKQRDKYDEKNKNFQKSLEKKKKEEECEELVLRKITVDIVINGKNFTETKIVECVPDLSVNDVDVQVNTDNDKPKITIKVIKKQK